MRRVLTRFRLPITRPEISPGKQTLELPFAFDRQDGRDVPFRQQLLDQLQQNCQGQLQLLVNSLQLTSALLLWPGSRPGEASIYARVSSCKQLLPGPFPNDAGILAALRDQRLVSLSPVRSHSPSLSYYPDNRYAKAFLGTRLDLSFPAPLQNHGAVLLCVDRQEEGWSSQELDLFDLVAVQLINLIDQTREYYLCDRQLRAYQRAFEGLQALNQALGLESAYAAIDQAVRQLVPIDFLAICLQEDERLRLAYLAGEGSGLQVGADFASDKGLSGQVLKYCRTLPIAGDNSAGSPILGDRQDFSKYASLLIVPLLHEERPVAGVLVLAGHRAGLFHSESREMLEMLASQIAVKIDLAHAHEQINRLATVDTLTGIANRRAYQRGFEAMLERAGRTGDALHLILCDIDHFKKINDRFGHPFGDEVLRQVAGLFGQVTRSVDLAARTGGEEFAIVLEGSDKQGAWKVAERLRRLVESLDLEANGEEVRVTLSLGLAEFPRDAGNPEKLVSCADQALYKAKQQGRNQTLRWTDLSPEK